MFRLLVWSKARTRRPRALKVLFRQIANPGVRDEKILLIILTVMLSSPVMADVSRDEKQAALDAACETAREEKLAPIRTEYVEDCVANKEQPNRAACERFYADYGGRMGGRAPLFYDLPECVEAFDYLQSAREENT
jgi:hypothetical protein